MNKIFIDLSGDESTSFFAEANKGGFSFP